MGAYVQLPSGLDDSVARTRTAKLPSDGEAEVDGGSGEWSETGRTTQSEVQRLDKSARTYIMVDAIAETLKRIEAAGGRVRTPRTEIGTGMGAFAVFTDPVGNEFGLYEEPSR